MHFTVPLVAASDVGAGAAIAAAALAMVATVVTAVLTASRNSERRNDVVSARLVAAADADRERVYSESVAKEQRWAQERMGWVQERKEMFEQCQKEKADLVAQNNYLWALLGRPPQPPPPSPPQ